MIANTVTSTLSAAEDSTCDEKNGVATTTGSTADVAA
jgi:hypothetical protein